AGGHLRPLSRRRGFRPALPRQVCRVGPRLPGEGGPPCRCSQPAISSTTPPVADNVLLSALVAALPIVVLLGLLVLFRVKAHVAALAGLAASLLVAIVVFGMPVTTAAAAATNGAAFGLFPIRS